VFGKARHIPPIPWTFSDGYVTWHLSVRELSGPANGCGTWRSVATYREYTTGTAFRFHLLESGC